MTDTITITAEQIAQELCWRLSNSNAELDEFDIAYDTLAEDDATQFSLAVNFHSLETGEHGFREFIVRIEAV
jgi:hypothetical protein